MNRRVFFSCVLLCSACLWTAPPRLFAQATEAQVQLSREQMEEFLRTARIVRTRAIPRGITAPLRATLSDGSLTHDAQIQSHDEYRSQFQSIQGTELNFKDTYKFNIAAYRLDKIMDLQMIPVSVERRVQGKPAAMTWWIDDVLMDETERMKQKIEPPDQDQWNRQMYLVRIFDQLIFNTDRNLGNLVIAKNWKIWMVDHTRAFRLLPTLRTPGNLVKSDRKLLAALRKLTLETLLPELQPYLTRQEVEALLARRDLIVQLFDQTILEKGEGAVLYDFLEGNVSQR